MSVAKSDKIGKIAHFDHFMGAAILEKLSFSNARNDTCLKTPFKWPPHARTLFKRPETVF